MSHKHLAKYWLIRKVKVDVLDRRELHERVKRLMSLVRINSA